MHVRWRLHTSGPGVAALYADHGDGPDLDRPLLQTTTARDVRPDRFIWLSRPAVGLTLDPFNQIGTCHLASFRVEPVPPMFSLLHALRRKFAMLRAHHNTGRVLLRGLWLLLTGQWQAVRERTVLGLTDPRHDQSAAYEPNTAYRNWRQQHALTDTDRARLRAEAATMADPPRFSILLPVYNTPEKYLRLAIESVRRQTYPFWQLCIADDGSTARHVRPMLEQYTALDPRIELAPLCRQGERHGGISAASNACLALADGEYVALLDHDDELAEHALSRMAHAVRTPDARGDLPDMVYSDEDKLTVDGEHVEPFFKPDWSPEFFQGCMYTCHLGVYRTALMREIGGFRPAFDGAQDYDLVLRLTSAGAKVAHVADVLYHWRKLPTSTASGLEAKPWAAKAAQRALTDWLRVSGREGTVEPGPKDGLNRVRFAIRGTPRVSIIMPSLCRPVRVNGRTTTWAEHALESIHQRSTWRNFEVIIVDQQTMPFEMGRRLARWGVRRLTYDEPFNWSTVNNRAAAVAEGDYLLFLNDDIQVRTPNWLESLLEFAQLPEVGAVGPKLLFPAKGGLQHAGVILPGGVPGHAYYRFPAEYLGYFGSAILPRNYSAVTGACLMTRAEVFRSVGGFDESFALNFNDIDYCLRLGEQGLRVVFTPYAELTHFESVTKSGVLPGEVGHFLEVWPAERLPRDPYYNPNLTRLSCDYRIARPDEMDIGHA